MLFSSRLKLTTSVSLLLIPTVGLALLGSIRLTTHAANTPKISPRTKLISATSMSACGFWQIVSGPNIGNSLFGIVLMSGIKKLWAAYYNNSSSVERNRGEEKSAYNITPIAPFFSHLISHASASKAFNRVRARRPHSFQLMSFKSDFYNTL